jgi:hypothetical protein
MNIAAAQAQNERAWLAPVRQALWSKLLRSSHEAFVGMERFVRALAGSSAKGTD